MFQAKPCVSPRPLEMPALTARVRAAHTAGRRLMRSEVAFP